MTSRAQDALFEDALEHHRAGRKAEAQALYGRVLESDPKHANALYLLSVIVSEGGQKHTAIGLLERAIESEPNRPAFHSNLGLLYRAVGRLDEAAAALLRSVELQPNLAETSFNLALVLEDKAELETALVCLERAAQLKPDVFVFQQRLANLLARRGNLERAALCLQRALEIDPTSLDAMFDLAKVLRTLGRFEEAERLCRDALALRPDNPVAYINLGSVWLEQGRLDDAIAIYRRALEARPGEPAAEANLGRALAEAGSIEDGLVHLRRAVDLSPDDEVAHGMLLYTLPFHPDSSDRDILAEGRAWSHRHADSLAGEAFVHRNDPAPERRLRIGYVSSDFRDHCQAFFMMGLLGEHDRHEVEVVCYSNVLEADHVTDRLRARADVWRDVAGMDDRALAHQVHRDHIDVCVDLTMHMRHGRLKALARKPAPVQACWLAYPGTTGMAAMDYRITDRWLDPPDSQATYQERSIRLPDTFWCYDPLTDQPDVSPLPALGNPFVTFGSFNHFLKTNRAVFDLWARVLVAIENSRLILLAPLGEARRRALEIFDRAGVEASRITFVSRVPRGEYLKWYQQVDICLDTFPYNGHTTSLDAFWMGVPVVTLVGRTVVGRAGLCQAENLGLPQLISSTPDEFVARAFDLASDLPGLAELRAALRERMRQSPLMDAPRFARSLEGAYRVMWRDWCAERMSPENRAPDASRIVT